MSVIVAGQIHVDPAVRDEFIEGHRGIVEKARHHPGCLDLSISPDPLEPGRVNLFEYWDSQETLDAWRAGAPRPTTTIRFKEAQVVKHAIARTGPPFD